jgi:hypothetical protein
VLLAQTKTVHWGNVIPQDARRAVGGIGHQLFEVFGKQMTCDVPPELDRKLRQLAWWPGAHINPKHPRCDSGYHPEQLHPGLLPVCSEGRLSQLTNRRSKLFLHPPATNGTRWWVFKPTQREKYACVLIFRSVSPASRHVCSRARLSAGTRVKHDRWATFFVNTTG